MNDSFHTDFRNGDQFDNHLSSGKGGFSRMPMKGHRTKKSSPSLLPLVVVLGFLFLGLLGFTVFRSVSSLLTSRETTAETTLLKPELEELPEYVNEEKIDVSGRTTPHQNVILVVNGDESTPIRSDQYGDFIFRNVLLKEGKNKLYVKIGKNDKVTKEKGEEKELTSIIRTITFDNEKPKVKLQEELPSKTNEDVITIIGTTDAHELYINDRYIAIDDDGAFESSVTLKSGNNDITLRAKDKAGNRTEETFRVEFTGKKATETPEKKTTITLTPRSTQTPKSPTATAQPKTTTPNPESTPSPHEVPKTPTTLAEITPKATVATNTPLPPTSTPKSS